jgi:hypothetical protein
VLPEGVRLQSDTILFDTKVALISYGENIHAVVIESSEILQAQRVAFEALWEQSRPY